MKQPIPITADTGEEVTVEMALDQATRATDLATDLAGALDEARELLIQVMTIAPGELEPPIRKEHGDITAAKRMERQTLEQKYALARMTARLSIRKVHDLEGKVEALEHRLGSQANECDEATQLVMQLTTAAMSLRAERDQLAHQSGKTVEEARP